MAKKPILTFNPKYNQHDYLVKFVLNAEKCLREDRVTKKNMASLASLLLYATIYTLPAYDLEKERIITFEEICSHCLNIIKFSLHDLLEVLCTFTCNKATKESVDKLLRDVLFIEACVYLNFNTRLVFTLLGYVVIKDKELVNLYFNNASIHELLNYYEEASK